MKNKLAPGEGVLASLTFTLCVTASLQALVSSGYHHDLQSHERKPSPQLSTPAIAAAIRNESDGNVFHIPTQREQGGE